MIISQKEQNMSKKNHSRYCVNIVRNISQDSKNVLFIKFSVLNHECQV